MKYSREIDGAIKLEINDDNKATVSSVDAGEPVTVQLANDDEVRAMIEEFEDEDRDMMYSYKSIFGKYKQLHQFRP